MISDCFSRFRDAVCPYINRAAATKLVTNAAQVAGEVIKEVLPYALGVVPQVLSTYGAGATWMIYPAFFLASTIVSEDSSPLFLTLFNMAGDICSPPYFATLSRVVTQSAILAYTGFKSVSGLREEMKNLQRAWQEKDFQHTSTNIQRFVSSFFKIGIGALGAYSCCHQATKILSGLSYFKNLDRTQQVAVIKNNAVQHLNTEKSCRAVIIDGSSSEWGKATDNVRMGFGELLYKHCDTRSYRILGNSDEVQQQFCMALKEGTEQLGGPLDVVSLQGHGWINHMKLGPNYDFNQNGAKIELNCLDKFTRKKGQVFLLGCNTATQTNERIGAQSLADHVARGIPKREVIGISSAWNPLFAHYSRENNKFKIHYYAPGNRWMPENQVVAKTHWVYKSRAP